MGLVFTCPNQKWRISDYQVSASVILCSLHTHNCSVSIPIFIFPLNRSISIHFSHIQPQKWYFGCRLSKFERHTEPHVHGFPMDPCRLLPHILPPLDKLHANHAIFGRKVAFFNAFQVFNTIDDFGGWCGTWPTKKMQATSVNAQLCIQPHDMRSGIHNQPRCKEISFAAVCFQIVLKISSLNEILPFEIMFQHFETCRDALLVACKTVVLLVKIWNC